LPILEEPVNLIDYLISRNRSRTFFGDPSGLPYIPSEERDKTDDLLLLVGPEGGFSHREIETLRDQKALPINLGRTRLRAELAATAITIKCLSGLGLF
jgi:16S rRNA (uracil1498-N3)-methyltransferase